MDPGTKPGVTLSCWDKFGPVEPCHDGRETNPKIVMPDLIRHPLTMMSRNGDDLLLG
jgi:hypothetical protein